MNTRATSQVIDGATDEMVATFRVANGPRGIHAAPDGKRLFVTLWPVHHEWRPALMKSRPADKTADGSV